VALGHRRRAAWFLVASISLGVTGTGLTSAAFNAEAANQTNGFAAAPDWVAPSADRSVVANEPPGYLTGFVRPGGAYRSTRTPPTPATLPAVPRPSPRTCRL